MWPWIKPLSEPPVDGRNRASQIPDFTGSWRPSAPSRPSLQAGDRCRRRIRARHARSTTYGGVKPESPRAAMAVADQLLDRYESRSTAGWRLYSRPAGRVSDTESPPRPGPPEPGSLESGGNPGPIGLSWGCSWGRCRQFVLKRRSQAVGYTVCHDIKLGGLRICRGYRPLGGVHGVASTGQGGQSAGSER